MSYYKAMMRQREKETEEGTGREENKGHRVSSVLVLSFFGRNRDGIGKQKCLPIDQKIDGSAERGSSPIDCIRRHWIGDAGKGNGRTGDASQLQPII